MNGAEMSLEEIAALLTEGRVTKNAQKLEEMQLRLCEKVAHDAGISLDQARARMRTAIADLSADMGRVLQSKTTAAK